MRGVVWTERMPKMRKLISITVISLSYWFASNLILRFLVKQTQNILEIINLLTCLLFCMFLFVFMFSFQLITFILSYIFNSNLLIHKNKQTVSSIYVSMWAVCSTVIKVHIIHIVAPVGRLDYVLKLIIRASKRIAERPMLSGMQVCK